MTSIKPCLWFDTQGLEAAEFYVSLIPNSRITAVSHYGQDTPMPNGGMIPAGTPLMVEFELDGAPFQALNGGPIYTFTEAISLSMTCPDQETLDRWWYALTDGGEEGRCGWLKDQFGLSWQLIPAGFGEIMGDPDPERAGRAMQAMMGMGRLDLAALRAAADGA